MMGIGKSKGWLRRGGLWTAVAGLTVLATSGLGLSADAAPAAGPINGCYLPLVNPAQLYVVTKAGSAVCPHGWTAVTWNTAGAQGPAGLGTGVTKDKGNPFSSSEPNGFPGCSITCFNS
jgi:hypothetical protein